MERYQVILAYDGSHFKGFQRQIKVRTVQGVVEGALRKIGWEGTSILAAGRTDAGTHAIGQVIAFDLEWVHNTHDLQQALNSHLPIDVVASEVKKVHPSFHPRYDAGWRKYQYRIYCLPVRQPLLEPYAWRVWPAVELNSLQEAASALVGTHDFHAFGTPPQSGGHTIRHVLETGWKVEIPYLVFEIKAHAFLYHMVRRLVFMQVRIVQGKLEACNLQMALEGPSDNFVINTALRCKGKRLVHGLAPAHGLLLAEVRYPKRAVSFDEDMEIVEKSADNY
jgi:tRNA pseudouridine38-40 synthase